MNHEPLDIAIKNETKLIGFCSIINRKSKYLIYDETHKNIKSSIRKILDYLETVVNLSCFCRSQIHPIEILINELDNYDIFQDIYTEDVSQPVSCQRCIALRVSKEFYDLGIVNIDLLFQFAVDLYLKLKVCGPEHDYRFTGCKKCHLRQAIEQLLQSNKKINNYIVVPEHFILEDDLYYAGNAIKSRDKYPLITDFNYYKG